MWSVSLAEHLQASTMCTAQATWREVCRWQNTYRPEPCALRRPLDVKCVAGRTLTGQHHVHCAGHLMWSVSLAEHLQASSMCTAQATWCEVCRWQNTYKPAPCALRRPRDVKCVAGRTLTGQLHVHCTGHVMWSVSLAEHLQASSMCTAQATWCEVCRWQNTYKPAPCVLRRPLDVKCVAGRTVTGQLCYITNKQPNGCDTQLAQTGWGKCLGVMSGAGGRSCLVVSPRKMSRRNWRGTIAGNVMQNYKFLSVAVMTCTTLLTHRHRLAILLVQPDLS